MKEARNLCTVYEPENQEIIVVFGGKKEVVECFDKKSLKNVSCGNNFVEVEKAFK